MKNPTRERRVFDADLRHLHPKSLSARGARGPLAESDFWHDLAKEFRELPCGDLRAEWILHFVPGSIPVWELTGNYSAQVRFRALAIRAGMRLVGRAPDFMFIWLDALNRARDYRSTI